MNYLKGENIIYKSISGYNLINTNESNLAIVIVTHLHLYVFNLLAGPYHESSNEIKLDKEKKYFKIELKRERRKIYNL